MAKAVLILAMTVTLLYYGDWIWPRKTDHKWLGQWASETEWYHVPEGEMYWIAGSFIPQFRSNHE